MTDEPQVNPKDIEYIMDRIRETYGATHVEHETVFTGGGECHIFNNDKSVYAACHIAKGVKATSSEQRERDDFDYELAIRSLFSDDIKGTLVVDKGITIDSGFVSAVNGDLERAANMLYHSLKEGKVYLALVKVPKTAKSPAKNAANIAALIMYDWGISHEDIDDEPSKVAGTVVPKTPGEIQSA